MKEDEDAIYLDHSILSTSMSCLEKARLAYVEHLAKRDVPSPLTFGSAFHAGVAAFLVEGNANAAEHAFLNAIREREGATLPLESDKRSIEKGLLLLQAYAEKWKNAPYEVMRSPSGIPYVEIGFRLFLMEWRGRPVLLCGLIDSILRSKIDGQPYVDELKTTTKALSTFVRQAKPNHQVTLYDYAVTELFGIKPTGAIWDAVYLSSRQPNSKGKTHWERSGIKLDEDFSRTITTRSVQDHDDMLFDLRNAAITFLTWRERDAEQHWPRNTSQCHNYGGCQFADVCISRNNTQIKSNFFTKYEWRPWEGRTVVRATRSVT